MILYTGIVALKNEVLGHEVVDEVLTVLVLGLVIVDFVAPVVDSVDVANVVENVVMALGVEVNVDGEKCVDVLAHCPRWSLFCSSGTLSEATELLQSRCKLWHRVAAFFRSPLRV